MNNQKSFVNIALIVVVVVVIAVGGYFVFFGNLSTVTKTPSTNIEPATSQTNPVAVGRGGGGVDIPSVNDFTITSPVKGETWDKGDNNKSIKWTYPPELEDRGIHLAVYLVNLDLIARGIDSSGATLDVYTGFTKVPDSGKGEVAWSSLRPIPETAFYGYSGNSRIVIAVSDSPNLKSYQAASDIFKVSTTVTIPSAIVPIEITSPNANAEFKIGATLNIKWNGFTHPSDICEMSLAGPLDQNGQVIQSLAAVIPMGGPLCSSGAFAWEINSPYLHGGYRYNLIIRTPYDSYSRTIYMTVAQTLPSASNTAGWKTYSSDLMGIEVKYPPKYYVVQNFGNPGSDTFTSVTDLGKESDKSLWGKEVGGLPAHVQIIYHVNRRNLSIADLAKEWSNSAGTTSSCKNFTIVGKSALRCSLYVEGEGGLYSDMIFLKYGGATYSFATNSPTANDVVHSDLLEILSTLKFFQ